MMLVKMFFAVDLVLLAISIILIFLGEMGVKKLARDLDILYYIGSFFGLAMVAIVIWGVFSL